MRFESEQDLKRERKAIDTFVNVFGGSAKKLGPNDVDYKVFDKEEETFFKYSPVKKYKKTPTKKTSNENPFKILKNLNFG